MNVTQKVWLGFGSILGLVAIGAGISGYESFRGEAASNRLVREYLAEFRAVNSANDELGMVRLQEERFIADKKPADANLTKASVPKLKEDLVTAGSMTPNAERREAIQKTVAAIDLYATAFARLEQLMVRRGLTSDAGLEGEMRAAVHQVESKVKEQKLPSLDLLMLMARRQEKDYLLRGDSKYFDELKATIGEFEAQMQQLSLSSGLQQEFSARWQQYFAAMKAVVDGDMEIRQQRAELARLGATLDAEIGAIVTATTHDIEQAGVATIGALTLGRNITAGAGVLSFVVGITLALIIARGIARPLRRMADTLAGSAEQNLSAAAQFSVSSQTLAEGSTQQASSLEETSAALEEVASMAKRNAESATEANALSNQARTAADACATKVDEMKRAMDEIKVSSDGISKIIKTIDEIAFQTNILALNAAVEAARAGEAGAGFAVVADEVRNLARRAADSAKETAEKIEDSTQKSAVGVAISEEVGRALAEILDKTRKVDTLVAAIAQASTEQTQGLAQVNQAVMQMDKVTQSNAGSAEESASAAEELNAQAIAQKETVKELRELVGVSMPQSVSEARNVIFSAASVTTEAAHPSASVVTAVKSQSPTWGGGRPDDPHVALAAVGSDERSDAS